MAGVTFRRIASPVDDKIRTILDFAKCASHLATQLGGYLSGAVSKRRVAINHAADQLGQVDGLSLSFTRDVT